MYLSDKKNDSHGHDHEDLELLLESFSKQVEEIVNEAETIEVRLLPFSVIERFLSILQSNVHSTQEIVELILDSNRNALLALDLQVGFLCFNVIIPINFYRLGFYHDARHWHWCSRSRAFWNECMSQRPDL